MWAKRYLYVSGLLVLTVCGCTPLDFNKSWPFKPKAEKPQVPKKIVDIWSNTVLSQPGLPGVRGFGGRIMFHNDDNKPPIKVDGTLSVYVFDVDSDPVQTPPERKFVFGADELDSHYSKSKIGHSYNFWLPFDEVGGTEREVTLVVRFEASSGEVLLSSPVRQTLAGSPPDKTAKRRTEPGTAQSLAQDDVKGQANGEIRTMSYETAVPQAPPGAMASTVTIDVPPSFAQSTRAMGAAQAADALRYQAAAKASPVETSPSASSVQSRSPARRATAAQARHAPVRRQPHPATWPSPLPTTPRSDTSGETQDSTGFGPSSPFPPTADSTR